MDHAALFRCRTKDIDQPDFLSRIELDQLKDGKEFLSQVRFALHSMTGRAEDRLLFDHQKKLAEMQVEMETTLVLLS